MLAVTVPGVKTFDGNTASLAEGTRATPTNSAARPARKFVMKAPFLGYSRARLPDLLRLTNPSDRPPRDPGQEWLRTNRSNRLVPLANNGDEPTIAKTHGEAYIAGAKDQPDFGGHKFNLSPNHPRPDECDMHARANLHGLGPGVYPDRASCPWPAHPNTLSYVTIVFIDEVADEDRQAQTDALSWLKRQTASRQEAVLGSQKKREVLERGILGPDEILTPWHVLRERYAQRGIDI